ncbi:MAG: carbohydrate binding domain-containing protein [Flavobacteriaceae bacterium]|nr:carbohydrate binding domain-containing protein [Flavobacteriaceae bacterium]
MTNSRLTLKRNFLAIILSFGLQILWAQDYYVSDSNGSDNNSGTIDSPFKTINKGISMVNAGGTVYVMNGVYQNANYGNVDPSTSTNMNNQHVVTINKSGTEDAYITLRNYPGDTPKIQFDGRGGIVISNNMNYIIIEGFEVEGPAQDIDYDMAEADRNYKIQVAEDEDDSTNYNHSYFGGKGIWGGYGAHHHIIIRNNIVHDTCGSAIRFNDSDHILIENNIVYNSNWWTSSASSAIVLAESIAQNGDNTSDIKMIIRGNIVYNNWNRIRFYVTQLPDNSGNNNPDYGTANFQSIWDGQGIYVTRSDPGYNGTFLFENNLCLNNGKNGINFDHSHSASAIYQNNTLYYNGVHEIIQDISVAEGNPAHRGQKVGGIKANHVLNATVVNNIIVTRDNEFSALQLNNVYGSRVAVDNIIVNGTYAWPATESNNLINVDPLFTSAPETVDGPLTIEGIDFSLTESSPAINSGNPSYSPTHDIDGNPRPVTGSAISSTSFENATGGWTAFGSTIETTSDESLSGDRSLFTTDRTANWHSPRIVLNNLLDQGEIYTFYIWVKLAEGETGTAQLTIKDTDENEYYNLTEPIEASDQEWTLLTADFTHDISNNLFLYVKGPPVQGGIGADYYIDDFSLVNQGSPAVDFENSGDIIDIGAYEFSINECANDTTPPVIELSDCGGSGCNYEYELNSTFDINDIDPPTITDNCDGDIDHDISHNVDTSTTGLYLITFTASDSSGNSTSSQVEVTVVDPLSISENDIKNIFLFPNPVKDILNIHNVYSNSNISLYNILGKKYEIDMINNFESNSISVNISSLEPGLYFLSLEDINTGQLKILRLVKQ